LPVAAGRPRRPSRVHSRHLVLRLVEHRPEVARGGDFPGHIGRCVAGDARHSRPHRAPRLSAGITTLRPGSPGPGAPVVSEAFGRVLRVTPTATLKSVNTRLAEELAIAEAQVVA